MSEHHSRRQSAGPERADIVAILRRIFKLRAAGDVAGMFRFAAPDLVYRSAGWSIYPTRVVGRGRAESFEIARQLNVGLENLGSEFHEIVVDGDRVALLRTAQMRNRGTGIVVTVTICDFIRFRDGLVVEFEEYPDAAAIPRLLSRPT